LKVTGNNGVVAKFGKDEEGIIKVTKNDQTIFSIDDYGALTLNYAANDLVGQDNYLLASSNF
jgi:hypothetical protein